MKSNMKIAYTETISTMKTEHDYRNYCVRFMGKINTMTTTTMIFGQRLKTSLWIAINTSALEVCHDKALYKSTFIFTLSYYSAPLQF